MKRASAFASPRAQRQRCIALLSAAGLSSAFGCSDAGSSALEPALGGADDVEDSSPAPSASGEPRTPATAGAGGGAGGAAAGVEPEAPCSDQTCSAFASCSTDGAAASCQCAPGLEGDGLRCGDVDECSAQNNPCGDHGRCQNGFGSYRCSCETGYSWNGTGCVDLNECDQQPCDAAALCSIDAAGGFSCSCGPGTFGDGFFCNPTDACAADPCGGDGVCVNLAGGGHACQCRPGFAGRDGCTPCGTDLVIADPGLRAAVNRQLGRALEDASAIPLGALSGHTRLDASGFDVTDLTGLACWPDLESLHLSQNPGFDLGQDPTELSGLNRLRELHLDCTGSTDLAPLAAHPTLRVLSVNVVDCSTPTRLADASAAGSIPQLEYLDLRGQQLDSVAFLSDSRSLRSLWLGHNRLQSLEELSRLALLRELDLYSNVLERLDGLDGMLQLELLNVAHNQLSDLQASARLPRLRAINASHNVLASLPDWSDLLQLSEVTVSDNRLDSVAPLSSIGPLLWLNLAGNQIGTLSPLVGGALRGTLVVEGNPLLCAAEEAHLRALRARGVDIKGSCQP